MTQATTTAKPPIHPGMSRECQIPGTSIVVKVANDSRPGANVWRIETRTNTGRMDVYSKSYTDEDTCRDDARRLCRDFAAGRTPRTLDEGPEPAATIVEPKPQPSTRSYNEVARELDWENRRRGAMRNGNRIARLEAELATIPFPHAA